MSATLPWRPKQKSAEEMWKDLVIKKNEYYDIITTEECLADKQIKSSKDNTDHEQKRLDDNEQ